MIGEEKKRHYASLNKKKIILTIVVNFMRTSTLIEGRKVLMRKIVMHVKREEL